MPRVAVLGGGIMGTCTALLLARRGADVTLFEAKPKILLGASRWNEGKIHLGYLYSGDASLATAKQLITGGLRFRSLIEEISGTSLRDVTQDDDLYLVHKDSVVSPDQVKEYFKKLTRILCDHPDKDQYWGSIDTRASAGLSEEALKNLSNPEYVCAGFMAPERSVCTQFIADSLSDAVYSEPRIEVRTDCRVVGASRSEERVRDRYHVETASDFEAYSHVVNCLWEGRPKVDSTIGVHNLSQPSLRYRCSLFVRTSKDVSFPSAVICTGPFGDIKSYTPNKFYLSWYPSGLLSTTNDVLDVREPSLTDTDKSLIVKGTFENLCSLLPATREILQASTSVSVEGGWVFANGRGLLSDPRSTLHKRHLVGVDRTDRWYSVDTGKYSLAPWLAQNIAEEILASQ